MARPSTRARCSSAQNRVMGINWAKPRKVWALTKKRTLRGGALKRGHGAALEGLAQLVDALGGVGAAAIIIEAAELVVGQAAKGRRSVNGR